VQEAYETAHNWCLPPLPTMRDIDDNFIDCRVRFLVAQAKSRNSLHRNVMSLLRSQGLNAINQDNATRKRRKDLHDEYVVLKNEVKVENCSAIERAERISGEAARAIDRRHQVNREERRKARRAHIQDIVGDGVELTPEIVHGFEYGNLRNQLHLLANVRALQAGEKDGLVEKMMETYQASPQRAKHRYFLQAFGVHQLLTSCGIDIETLQHDPIIRKPADYTVSSWADDEALTLGLGIPKNMTSQPARFIQNTLKMMGIPSKADRRKVNGKQQYVGLTVDVGILKQMLALSDHLLEKILPVDPPEQCFMTIRGGHGAGVQPSPWLTRLSAASQTASHLGG
jgi:hypothetical protein